VARRGVGLFLDPTEGTEGREVPVLVAFGDIEFEAKTRAKSDNQIG